MWRIAPSLSMLDRLSSRSKRKQMGSVQDPTDSMTIFTMVPPLTVLPSVFPSRGGGQERYGVRFADLSVSFRQQQPPPPFYCDPTPHWTRLYVSRGFPGGGVQPTNTRLPPTPPIKKSLDQIKFGPDRHSGDGPKNCWCDPPEIFQKSGQRWPEKWHF